MAALSPQEVQDAEQVLTELRRRGQTTASLSLQGKLLLQRYQTHLREQGFASYDDYLKSQSPTPRPTPVPTSQPELTFIGALREDRLKDYAKQLRTVQPGRAQFSGLRVPNIVNRATEAVNLVGEGLMMGGPQFAAGGVGERLASQAGGEVVRRVSVRLASRGVKAPKPVTRAVTETSRYEPVETVGYTPKGFPIQKGKGPLETRRVLASQEQVQAIQDLAAEAGWSEKRLRNLIRAETGQRGNLTVFERQRLAKTPSPKGPGLVELEPEQAAKVLTSLKKYTSSGEVGILEQFRPAWRVIEEKIGLGEEIYRPVSRAAVRIADEERALAQVMAKWRQTVGPGKRESGVLFRMADGNLSSTDQAWLAKHPDKLPVMQQVVNEWRQLSGKQADELGIPVDQQIPNYITHIFERRIAQDLAAKRPIPEEIRAVLGHTAPSKIRTPFVEERTGARGFKHNFWDAVEAWTRSTVRSKHYTQALQEVQPRIQFLKPKAQQYVRDWLSYRIARRPHRLDEQISQTLSEGIERLTLGKIKPNPVRAFQDISDTLTNASYRGALLGNVRFWVMNTMQPFLTVADQGVIASAKGASGLLKPAARQILAEFPSIRNLAPTEFLTGSSAKKILEAPGMTPTRVIEFVNRAHAGMTGYLQAVSKGMSHDAAIEAAEELIRRTQFSYREIDLPLASASAFGKSALQFKTWGINFLELLKDWSKIKQDPKNAVKLGRFLIYGYLADRAFKEVGVDLSRALHPGVMLKEAVSGFRVTAPASWQFVRGAGMLLVSVPSGDERLFDEGLREMGRGVVVLLPYGVQARRLFRYLAGEDELIEFFVPTVRE